MLLYVNGCSWSSSSSPTMTTKVYADFLSEKLKCKSINHSIPASSNKRIIRSTVRNLLSLKQNYKNIICVVNITQPYRYEVWLNESHLDILRKKTQLNDFDYKILEKYRNADDGMFKSFIFGDKLLPLRVLPHFNDLENNVLHFLDDETVYYQLFVDILLFTNFCKVNDIKYLIFAGTKLAYYDSIDKEFSYIKDFYRQVINDPAVLDFESLNFCGWTKSNGYNFFEKENEIENFTTGHPDQQAHEIWSEILYQKLKSLYDL